MILTFRDVDDRQGQRARKDRIVSIDVVVVNYHTPDDLNDFVRSLERQPPSVVTTLTIVDVDSEDYGHRITWGSGRPGRHLGVATNIGYGRACNLGAVGGTGDVIALFNADIVLSPGALDECAGALLAHGDWAVLGPCQVDHRNRVRHAGIFGTHTRPVHRGWDETYRGQYRDIAEAVTVSGSAYFVKRSVWRQLTACHLFQDIAPGIEGAMLPTPHYYEETWVSWHAAGHGYKVMYYGPVTVTHKWHQASPLGGWADQQMAVSRAIFRRACEHHGFDHD